ncbi:hypothetical protein PACTADRAFT_3834 [Pachysolen tannophilus NRRL Y-2460]|uniref:Beta-catenin-like protein 1 N-terminal domain-containing protein n=1 Tax=Pachysolen tannophilus NRRL Y-2460 TaxID=669874 RepID=A0A1E4TT85_PACTA|nr:hypothetical protein PACTADRAFT_3834 [Pachysolen tannophilus NRRL Y-2460]
MNTDSLFNSKKHKIKDVDDSDNDAEDVQRKFVRMQGEPVGEVRILKYIEDLGPEQKDEVYDSSWLNKTLNRLNKAIVKNSELRSKHGSNPSNFVESEFELNQSIKNLSGLSLIDDLAKKQELLNFFYQNMVTLDLISLIDNHPNLDISSQVVRIFNDIIDEEDDEDDKEFEDQNEEIRLGLANFLSNSRFVESLTKYFFNLQKTISDPTILQSYKAELLECLSICLNIFINLVNLGNLKLNEILIKNGKLMEFLISQIKVEINSIDVNSQYIAEFLSNLLIKISEVSFKIIETEILFKYNIVENLLIMVSKLLKFDTEIDNFKDEQKEFLENNIDSLCLLLNISNVSKKHFQVNEGLELIFLILNKTNNKYFIGICVKILSNLIKFTLTDEPDDIVYAIILQMINGNGCLKPLFKLYKSYNDDEEILKNLNNIILSFSKNLSMDSNERIRLVNKFVDKNFYYAKKILSLRSSLKNKSKIRESQIYIINQITLILAWLCAILVDYDYELFKQLKNRLNLKEDLKLDDYRLKIEQFIEFSDSGTIAQHPKPPSTIDELFFKDYIETLKILQELSRTNYQEIA